MDELLGSNACKAETTSSRQGSAGRHRSGLAATRSNVLSAQEQVETGLLACSSISLGDDRLAGERLDARKIGSEFHRGYSFL